MPRGPRSHALEIEPGLHTHRVSTRGDVAERKAAVDHDSVLRGHATVGDQLVDKLRVVFHARAEDLRPECGLSVRVGAVERHLRSHRRALCQTGRSMRVSVMLGAAGH